MLPGPPDYRVERSLTHSLTHWLHMAEKRKPVLASGNSGNSSLASPQCPTCPVLSGIQGPAYPITYLLGHDSADMPVWDLLVCGVSPPPLPSLSGTPQRH